MNSKSNPEITIIIVTWNSEKFLPELSDSIHNQSYQDFSLVVVDNGSTDGTADFVKKQFPEVTLIRNEKNTGYAKANNLGIKMSRTPFVLICNPDIILDSNYLAAVLKAAKADNQIGSVGGKLIKLDPNLNQKLNSANIDSTGIVFFKNRRAIDRGENEKDQGQFEQKEEVFGISGALVLYQKLALERTAINGEFFDEDFFAYKEDLDLAWRLRSAGFKSVYLPNALAFHQRATARRTDLSDQGTMINRMQKNQQANYLSYRNHLFLLIKNERFSNIFLNPRLIWYELKKFLYLLFFETTTLSALFDFYRKLSRMLKKRQKINEKRKVPFQKIVKWFR